MVSHRSLEYDRAPGVTPGRAAAGECRGFRTARVVVAGLFRELNGRMNPCTIHGRITRLAVGALLAEALLVSFHASTAAAQGIPGGLAKPASREPQTAEEAAKCSIGVVGEAKPGGSVRVAVRFDMAPSWHIYWENAGESGAPTRIELDLPDGCAAARMSQGRAVVDFPIPSVFEHGETTFGYEGSVVLSTEVRLPAAIPAGGLPAKVRVRWLACKERCLMGSAEATVDLAKGVAADSPEGRALAASLERVPAPLPADWSVAVRSASAEGARLEISAPAAVAADASWTFIPFDTPGVVLASGYKADAKGRTASIEHMLSRESALEGPLEAGGIIVLGKKGPAYAFRKPIPAP